MIERRMRGWLAGLGALIVGTGALAVWLLSYSVDLQMLVNDFYTSQTSGEPLDEETYRYWDALSRNSYLLQQLSIPVLLSCVVAIFAVVAVLARRWDVARGRALRVEGQDAEATAAS